MKKELVLYRCEICGNLVCMVENSGVIPYCCGTEMTKVEAGTVDASREKHVPVAENCKNDCIRVRVGAEAHPMTKEHYIDWIVLLTDKGAHAERLDVNGEPAAEFHLTAGEKAQTVYAFCNIHGLWKTELITGQMLVRRL